VQSDAPVLGWGVYGEDETLTYHAVLEIQPRGSVVTGCRGRWESRDPWAWFPGRDTIVFPKCGACVRYVNAEREREGLDAITGTHPWSMPVEQKFDLGGEG